MSVEIPPYIAEHMPRLSKVYRSGVVAAPVERGDEAESFLSADFYRPSGRTSRTEAIFASPNLQGVGYWVVEIARTGRLDVQVREISVDPDMTMVYHINAWEYASFGRVRDSADKGAALYAAYWTTGMTLTEWNARNDLDGTEWEILLSDAEVLSQGSVSAETVTAAQLSAYDAEMTLAALKGEL